MTSNDPAEAGIGDSMRVANAGSCMVFRGAYVERKEGIKKAADVDGGRAVKVLERAFARLSHRGSS